MSRVRREGLFADLPVFGRQTIRDWRRMPIVTGTGTVVGGRRQFAGSVAFARCIGADRLADLLHQGEGVNLPGQAEHADAGVGDS